jgi:sugar/nucleoside kinase (ribokinase family)
MNLWIDLFPNEVNTLISKVDLFMLNDDEAKQLTNKDNLEEIANDLLAMGPKIIVIKKGGEGSLLAYENNKINISVVPNTPIYDPTGAGDSFAGGMLGYIALNGIENPENAVAHGTAVASYTVSGFGLENLCKLKQSDLNNKIQQIKIK